MTTRNRIFVVLLWLSVLAQTTWVGGTLYQMLVIVPMWSASPPDSVRAFFQGTDYNHTIFNFFGRPFMIARVLPVVLALLVGWHLPRHRRALLLAVICLGFAVVFTLLYVYPINAVLFAKQVGATVPRKFAPWSIDGFWPIGCGSRWESRASCRSSGPSDYQFRAVKRESRNGGPNQSLEPTAGRRDAQI